MSRLESFIRRLQSQQRCLDLAVELIADLPGPVIELGLGNGRTYDHLRTRLPDRRILVIEREPRPHPSCWPPEADLLVGRFEATLPLLAHSLGCKAALIHCDIGSGDAEANALLVAEIAPMLPSILREGGIMATDQPMEGLPFESLPLPAEVEEGRYFLHRQP